GSHSPAALSATTNCPQESRRPDFGPVMALFVEPGRHKTDMAAVVWGFYLHRAGFTGLGKTPRRQKGIIQRVDHQRRAAYPIQKKQTGTLLPVVFGIAESM